MSDPVPHVRTTQLVFTGLVYGVVGWSGGRSSWELGRRSHCRVAVVGGPRCADTQQGAVCPAFAG